MLLYAKVCTHWQRAPKFKTHPRLYDKSIRSYQFAFSFLVKKVITYFSNVIWALMYFTKYCIE